MPLSASRHLFSRLLLNNNKKYIKCHVNVRFKSDSVENRSSETKIEAAVLKKLSEPLQIEKIDLSRKLLPHEVRIDVNFCALNGLDVLLCENLYSHEPKLPFVPGYELSGKLLEVGEEAKKAGYNVGDKVIAFNKETFGGLADQCIAAIDDTWIIPPSIKSIDAVCLLENYMTALLALEQYGSISEEDVVLISVGIGGIGLAAIDIAAHVFKAKVIGVTFSEDRCAKLRERGAFNAFTYKEKKLIKEIKAIAEEKDIKDVFDDDSGENFKKVLKSFMSIYESKTPSKDLLRDDNFGIVTQHLSQNVKAIIAGVTNTKSNKVEEKEKTKERDLFHVTGINIRDYKNRKPELYRQTADDVITFFEEELIKPMPSMVAGLNAVNEAFQYLSTMKACGKVVIDIKNKDKEATIL